MTLHCLAACLQSGMKMKGLVRTAARDSEG